MSYRIPTRLEDLDLKAMSIAQLGEYLFEIDAIQARRFRKLADEVREIAFDPILNHLLACQKMDVLPQKDAVREVIDDAQNGRSFHDGRKLQYRLDSYVRPEEIEESTEDDMRRNGAVWKKVSGIEISSSNQLFLLVKPKHEATFVEWLGKTPNVIVKSTDFVKTCGGFKSTERNVWSLARRDEFSKAVRNQLNPKIGPIQFKYFDHPIALARAVADKLLKELPSEVLARLEERQQVFSVPAVNNAVGLPPHPVAQPKEKAKMIRTHEEVLDQLPRWIFAKAKGTTGWQLEFERLWNFTRDHADFAGVNLAEFTSAMFHALCLTSKMPSDTTKHLIFYLMDVNGWGRKDKDLVVKALHNRGFQSVNESILELAMSQYVPSELAVGRDSENSERSASVEGDAVSNDFTRPKVEEFMVDLDSMDFSSMKLTEMARVFLTPNGELIENFHTTKDLFEYISEKHPGIKLGSFTSTFYAVARKQKSPNGSKPETAKGTKPQTPRGSRFDEVKSDQVKAGEGSVLTIHQILQQYMNPDGSYPASHPTRLDFIKLVNQINPEIQRVTILNSLADFRRKLRNGQIVMEQRSPEVEPESRMETGEELEPGAETQEAFDPSEGLDKTFDEEPEPDQSANEEASATPAIIAPEREIVPEPIKAVESSDGGSELERLKAKIAAGRDVYDFLGNHPEFLEMYVRFKATHPNVSLFEEN